MTASKLADITPPKTALEILRNTKVVLDTYGWVRGSWQNCDHNHWNKKEPNYVPPKECAASVCLQGAVVLATIDHGIANVGLANEKIGDWSFKKQRQKLMAEYHKALNLLRSTINSMPSQQKSGRVFGSIPSWNDQMRRRRRDVYAVLNRAIALAEKAEQA